MKLSKTLLISFFVASLFSFNCSEKDSSDDKIFRFIDGVQYKVSQVIDGDTVVLENNERVRYIGIDCPEIAHNDKECEFFGEKAKQANKRLVDGKIIALYFDKQKRDVYKRILAYVFIDTIFVNAQLVKNGFAGAKSYPPNIKHDNMFYMLENEAKSNNRGIWQNKIQPE